MTVEELATLKAMREFGGSFVQALAHAYPLADDSNAALIRATWPGYWAKYKAMAAAMQKRCGADWWDQPTAKP